MANVRSGNTHYIDTTGSLVTAKNTKIAYVVVTATAASAVLELGDATGPVKKLDLRVATDGESKTFDFSRTPINFPNGVEAITVTNCVATVVYSLGGAGRA